MFWSFYVAYFSNPFMYNHSEISTSNDSLFLTGGSSFSDPSITISSGLSHFFSLSFSGPVPLFEATDTVLLMAEIYFHTVETLTSLYKTVIYSPYFRGKYCDEETHPIPWYFLLLEVRVNFKGSDISTPVPPNSYPSFGIVLHTSTLECYCIILCIVCVSMGGVRQNNCQFSVWEGEKRS